MEISTMTTILMASMNVWNADGNFAYNAEMDGDAIAAQVVYLKSEDGKYLSNHLKYNYVYDEEGRLAQKEVLKWDAQDKAWKHSHTLNYTYDFTGYSIEYVAWNEKQQEYADVMAKQTYEENIAGTVAVALYQWDKADHHWIEQERNLLMNGAAGYLTLWKLEI